MRKARAAFYVAALATMIAVWVESLQEKDLSSALLASVTLGSLLGLFLGEDDRDRAT